MGYHHIKELANKMLHNQSLARLVQKRVGLPTKQIKSAVIDSEFGHSSKTLIEIGVQPAHVMAVNHGSQASKILKKNGFCTFPGSFTEFIERKFEPMNVIYYDSCSNLEASYKDLYNIFAQGTITNGILMVTLTSRTNTKFDIDALQEPYKIQHWWNFTESDTWSAYYADQLIKDYASRFGYKIERVMTDEIPKAQYKKTMFCLQYLVKHWYKIFQCLTQFINQNV